MIFSCVPNVGGMWKQDEDVSGIDESVQKQIKELHEWHDKAAEGLGLDGYLIIGPSEEFRYRLGKIALESGNLMSDQQKLNHLRGDDWVRARIAIVEKMVTCQHIDPNTISYRGCNPLYEAVVYKDLSFTKLLLGKGAKPDKETFEMMRKKPEFGPLMLQYNLTE
jgi:hypothetical protein